MKNAEYGMLDEKRALKYDGETPRDQKGTNR